ncbi:MAG: hybrid sensor histidine kinase/response regulator [Prevotellaceae bacterium]|nr:hybrid sensor histidine kinase/response regulator [Prevotellaceae bacterium]
MRKNIEYKIRINAVLAYIIIAGLCAVMVFYIYKAKEEIDGHRQYLEQSYQPLQLAHELTHVVNQAQSDANFYIITKQFSYLKNFRESAILVDLLIDSLSTHVLQDTAQLILLQELRQLLFQKEEIATTLQEQLTAQNPLDSISKKVREYALLDFMDSLIVTTLKRDTIISTTPQRGFWQRLGNVFSPLKSVDTLRSVSTTEFDTLLLSPNNRKQILEELNRSMALASRKYNLKINAIERDIARLIFTDQEISLQISTLLKEFHGQTIASTLEKAKQSEAQINKNYNLIIIGGAIALLLILVFILLIISDVNKGYAARKALEQANERTKQIMESRHRLLLSVSHDIKTPLNSILGYLELWDDVQNMDKTALASMQNSGKHILALLENLLEFSSLEQGTLQVAESGFNLYDLCIETAEMFSPLAQQKQLAFHFSPNINEDFSVLSDRLKVKQIIINILSNAVKYTTKGEVSFKIKAESELVRFIVADTGAGIPQDQLNDIFKAFSRVSDNVQLAEGSGLGMFVVKGLVELLNGTIDVKSAVGKDTEITISIPMKTTEINTVFKAKHVLIIDDDLIILSLLKDMLTKLGHSADVCHAPAEYDKYIAHIFNYDVVITDMEMGQISGKDVLAQVKNIGVLIPIIIMTGRGDFHNIKAAEYGFDGYLAKPVKLNSLALLLGSKTNKPLALTSLEVMFDNDKEAIRQILDIFLQSTTENINALNTAIADNDFNTAQGLCHKMLPMFLQLGINNVSNLLKKMDTARGNEYPQWEEDVKAIIEGSRIAISMIN